LEILVRECQVQVQGLNRPQELRIFHEDIEFEQKIYWAHYLSRFVSRSLKVDLIFISLFHFIFIFLFIFNLFSIFRTRVRVRVTKITLSHSRSHQMTQSQVT